ARKLAWVGLAVSSKPPRTPSEPLARANRVSSRAACIGCHCDWVSCQEPSPAARAPDRRVHAWTRTPTMNVPGSTTPLHSGAPVPGLPPLAPAGLSANLTSNCYRYQVTDNNSCICGATRIIDGAEHRDLRPLAPRTVVVVTRRPGRA